MSTSAKLATVKLVHTIVWAVVAGCIVAIPALAWAEMYRPVLWLTGIVLAECVVLLANGWRCPLTGVAARYTDERRDGFDIFLPAWLARNNKMIFGTLFVAGELFAALRWSGWIG